MRELTAYQYITIARMFGSGGYVYDGKGTPLFGMTLAKGESLAYQYLRFADLRRANLRDVDLRGTSLQLANLENANLWNANLQNANMRDANIQSVDLWGANLLNADLLGANLCNSNLYLAQLEGSNLENANLEFVNLQNANLENATLAGVNLHCARLDNANLKGVRGLLYELDVRHCTTRNYDLGVFVVLPVGATQESNFESFMVKIGCAWETVADMRVRITESNHEKNLGYLDVLDNLKAKFYASFE